MLERLGGVPREAAGDRVLAGLPDGGFLAGVGPVDPFGFLALLFGAEGCLFALPADELAGREERGLVVEPGGRPDQRCTKSELVRRGRLFWFRARGCYRVAG